MGSLHNIDFGCVLGKLREGTGFREPASGNPFLSDRFSGLGNQFWEPDPGFDMFRQVLRFQGSGPEG